MTETGLDVIVSSGRDDEGAILVRIEALYLDREIKRGPDKGGAREGLK